MATKKEEPQESVSEFEPTPIEATHLYLAEPFASVISGMLRERGRQAEKGYTAEHDAEHSAEEWAQMFGQHYREALRLAKTGNLELFQNEVIQGAALYMAALESLVMNRAGEHTTKEAANKTPKQSAD